MGKALSGGELVAAYFDHVSEIKEERALRAGLFESKFVVCLYFIEWHVKILYVTRKGVVGFVFKEEVFEIEGGNLQHLQEFSAKTGWDILVLKDFFKKVLAESKKKEWAKPQTKPGQGLTRIRSGLPKPERGGGSREPSPTHGGSLPYNPPAIRVPKELPEIPAHALKKVVRPRVDKSFLDYQIQKAELKDRRRSTSKKFRQQQESDYAAEMQRQKDIVAFDKMLFLSNWQKALEFFDRPGVQMHCFTYFMEQANPKEVFIESWKEKPFFAHCDDLNELRGFLTFAYENPKDERLKELLARFKTAWQFWQYMDAFKVFDDFLQDIEAAEEKVGEIIHALEYAGIDDLTPEDALKADHFVNFLFKQHLPQIRRAYSEILIEIISFNKLAFEPDVFIQMIDIDPSQCFNLIDGLRKKYSSRVRMKHKRSKVILRGVRGLMFLAKGLLYSNNVKQKLLIREHITDLMKVVRYLDYFDHEHDFEHVLERSMSSDQSKVAHNALAVDVEDAQDQADDEVQIYDEDALIMRSVHALYKRSYRYLESSVWPDPLLPSHCKPKSWNCKGNKGFVRPSV